jgi:hypothetical protein
MSQSRAPPTGDGVGGTAGRIGSLDRDEVFETLSNRRRRYTLHYLYGGEGTAELGDLSEQVAAWESEAPVAEVGAAERKRVYTSLQQFHLPKMDEKGIVEFDDRAGTVELGAAAADLDVYMEVTEGRDPPWSVYYVGLAAVGLAGVGGSWLGAPALAGVSNAAWIAFLLVSFGLLSLAHTAVTRRMRIGSDGAPPGVEG